MFYGENISVDNLTFIDIIPYFDSSIKTNNAMKTYKIDFTNTSNILDFVTVDAKSVIDAISIFMEHTGVECISCIDVTGKFVDTDGTIKNK